MRERTGVAGLRGRSASLVAIAAASAVALGAAYLHAPRQQAGEDAQIASPVSAPASASVSPTGAEPGFVSLAAAYAPAERGRGRPQGPGLGLLEEAIGTPAPERADAPALREAIAAYRKGDLALGDAAAARALDDLGRSALAFAAVRLQPKAAGYARIAAFLDAHPDWPRDGFLQARLEEAILNEKISGERVRARFAARPPATPAGRFALAKALKADRPDEAQALARRIWRDDDFGGWLEGEIRKEFPAALRAQDHRFRAARLFYKEQHAASLRIAALAGEEESALAKARSAVAREQASDKLMEAVPKAARADPSYLFARVQKLRREGKLADAAAALEEAPREPERLVDGDAWWTERRMLARKSLDAGESERAYKVAAGHGARSSEDRIEAEFHAGWIALRFRNDPAAALPHFAAAGDIARTPISQARALYWQGRALEAQGDSPRAAALYKRAAEHSSAYYGQLARARLGHSDQPVRRALAVAQGDARLASVRAVEAFESIGEKDLAFRLTSDLARQLQVPAQIAALARVAARGRDARATLAVGKLAAQRGVALDDAAFPMFGVPEFEPLARSAEAAVVYAIARQESAFQADARSQAGAKGLMQMLASTARRTAQRAGVPFEEERLISDPAFNARLGAAHLAELMDEHGQSLLLTFAAYNAGGHRVKQWIAAYGDPRKPEVDPIDWVERIPFTETRNYVQRVVENLGVYRARFGAPDAPRLMVEDLRARELRLASNAR
jgi:soluble lytic murein transglycosylase